MRGFIWAPCTAQGTVPQEAPQSLSPVITVPGSLLEQHAQVTRAAFLGSSTSRAAPASPITSA